MTQKELLYVEDAIEHESCIISCIEEMINVLKEEDLITFTNKELKNHQNQKKNLQKLLEEKENE